MKQNRRQFLTGFAGLAALSLADLRTAAANELAGNRHSPIQVILPRAFPDGADFQSEPYKARLTRAVLETLQHFYSQEPMPVWEQPFGKVDMEVRIRNIIFWLTEGVRRAAKTYPLDPAWMMAQMMKESYFYEFAVSRALAVGICQFIQGTAEEYEMLCGGTRPEHTRPPYRETELAGAAEEYYRLRRERRNYQRKARPAETFTLDKALDIIINKPSKAERQAAEKFVLYREQIDTYHRQEREAMENFRQYLWANVEGRNIFRQQDLDFILGFDERFTYKKPAFGMCLMMARALRSRNGNILAATISYNAGLSSTRASGRYEPYGRIPDIEQSTTYLSHVMINHHEIVKRMA